MSFDNRSLIGTIAIRNGSRIGNGIGSSLFLVCAVGTICNIDMPAFDKQLMTAFRNRQASGVALFASLITASGMDPDQTVFSGSNGDITISAGRVIPTMVSTPIPHVLQPLPPLPPLPNQPPADLSTDQQAGFPLAYLAAYGGMGDVKINTIGTGIANAVLSASSDGSNPFIQLNLASPRCLPPVCSPVSRFRSLRVKAHGLFAQTIHAATTFISPFVPPPA